MSALRVLLCLWLVSVAACVRTREVTLPELGAGTSVVFVFVEEGRGVSLVFAGEEPMSRSFAFEKTQVYALYFGCRLAELRLPFGELEVVASEGRVLPEPERLFVLGDGESEFRETSPDALPAEVAELQLKLPPENQCARFSVDRIVEFPPMEEGGGEIANFGVPLDNGDLLTWTNQQRVFVIPAGEGEPVRHEELEIMFHATNGFRRDDGRIFVIGQGLMLGEVNQRPGGELELEVLSGARTTTMAGANWITGAPDGELELFALALDSSLHRYDGATWTELLPCTDCRPLAGRGGLAYVGRGEVYMIASRNAFHVRGDDIDFIPIELLPFGTFSAVAYLPDTLGAVIATFGGRIYRKEGESWRQEVDRRGYAPPIILPFEEGILFGGDGGEFTEYSLELGVCERAILLGNDIGSAITHQGQLVMFGGQPEKRAYVYYVTPQGRTPKACP